MRRREFIAGISAAAWPLAAQAQQPKVPVIGYLSAISRDSSATLEPFLQGLNQTGFVEGQNVAIEYRWAEGKNDRLPSLAADLVNRRVAVIAAIGGQLPAIAAKAATSTIPIVFHFGLDPVRQGLVASLSHPGGNATGSVNLTSQVTDTKAVEFLRELVPAAGQLALLVNPTNVPAGGIQALAAARELRWEFETFEASTEDGLDAAFVAMSKQKVGAVNVVPDTFFTSRRAQIAALATRYGIPASYYFREFVIVGGLMSYGADLREVSRVAGNYVGRILKGEKPADLPVQEAVKVELVINLKTAKALGLTIPTNLLVRADEVIDEYKTAGVHCRARQRGCLGQLQRTHSRGDHSRSLSIEILSVKGGSEAVAPMSDPRLSQGAIAPSEPYEPLASLGRTSDRFAPQQLQWLGRIGGFW